MLCVVVIDKDPDSASGVRFSEVSGCLSAADTFEEIVVKPIEAQSLFLEDTEPPPSRGLESVQAADGIADGAALMMIPCVRDRKGILWVKLSLETGVLDALDEAVRMRGMIRSAFVEKAATREIFDPACRVSRSGAGVSPAPGYSRSRRQGAAGPGRTAQRSTPAQCDTVRSAPAAGTAAVAPGGTRGPRRGEAGCRNCRPAWRHLGRPNASLRPGLIRESRQPRHVAASTEDSRRQMVRWLARGE